MIKLIKKLLGMGKKEIKKEGFGSKLVDNNDENWGGRYSN